MEFEIEAYVHFKYDLGCCANFACPDKLHHMCSKNFFVPVARQANACSIRSLSPSSQKSVHLYPSYMANACGMDPIIKAATRMRLHAIMDSHDTGSHQITNFFKGCLYRSNKMEKHSSSPIVDE